MMGAIKEFYGGTLLDSKSIESIAANGKVELKYYKIINSVTGKKNKVNKFGVEVVKKCVYNNVISEEKKEIFNFIENEDVADKVLEILKSNKVSPINVMDVLEDLSTKRNKLYIGEI